MMQPKKSQAQKWAVEDGVDLEEVKRSRILGKNTQFHIYKSKSLFPIDTTQIHPRWIIRC